MTTAAVDRFGSGRRRPIVPILIGGVAVGGLSVNGDGIVPSRAVVLVGNLAAPWVLTAYLVGRRASNPRAGAVSGALALLLGCLVYYLSRLIRFDVEFASFDPLLLIWFAVSILVGPIIGACGGAHTAGVTPVLRTALPSGAVLGEAIWFVSERQLWQANVLAEPHRLVDVAIAALLALTPLVIAARDRGAGRPLATWGSVVLAAGSTATGLWLVRTVIAG